MANKGTGPVSRRTIILIGAAVVAALIIVLVVLQLNRPEPQPAPTASTTTLPTPTPASEPIERDTSTALLAALPGTVLDYAVSDQVQSQAMIDASALEGWQLTYSSTDGVVLLQVGQWPTAEEATAQMQAVLASVDPAAVGVERERPVEVAGTAVGQLTVLALADGAGRAVWTNGTVLFVADGTLRAVDDFYDAFPL